MAENITGFQTADGVALVDYDYLANKPVTRIVSESADTAPVLRSLESGSYILQGKFRAYTGATGVLGFSSALMVNVIKSTAKSSVQIFYPVNNCVQFLEITDEAMTKTFVYLNQVLEHIGTMKNLTTEDKTSLVAAINELVARVSGMSGATGGGITEETDPTVPDWAKEPNKPTYTAEDVGAAEKDHNHDEKYQPKGNYAAEGHNHDGKYQPVGNYLTEESDPTVPSWAKQPAKPTYTADEVKARPDTWMPTAEDVGARPSTWTPTASDVGADKSGTAASKVTEHNAATDAHNDIRLLIQGLDARLTALADSDDTTLDQLSELVSYIKENRGLIEGITTNKVNVSDIINNLTTNDAKKPLSAAQGVALKALIDALTTTVNGKVTEAQVATAISNALKAYPTTTAMQTAISTALADYAKADHNHDGTYIKQTELDDAVDTALQTAKESGEFDGTSVTVTNVTESTESGGDNVVKFSDGTTLTVKNGKDGTGGSDVADGSITPEKTSFLLPVVVESGSGETTIEPDFTNLAKPETANDSSPDTSADTWLNGHRFSTTNGAVKTTTDGGVVSNHIPVVTGKDLYIAGLKQGSTTYFQIVPYDSDGNMLTTTGVCVNVTGTQNGVKNACEWGTITVDGKELTTVKYQIFILPDGTQNTFASTVAYVRVAGVPEHTVDDVIITFDEPITFTEKTETVTTTKYRLDPDVIDTSEYTSDDSNTGAVNKTRWCAMGDSITEGWTSELQEDGTSTQLGPTLSTDTTKWYVNTVARLNNYEVTNKGVGATGYTRPLDGNNFRVQVDSIDFTQYDLVTVFGGINDFKGTDSTTIGRLGTIADLPQEKRVSSGTTLSTLTATVDVTNGISVYADGVLLVENTDYTLSDTTITFTNALTEGTMVDVYPTEQTVVSNLAYVIKKISRQNPYCKLVIITPLNSCTLGYYETNYSVEYNTGTNSSFGGTGGNLDDMVEVVTEVCKHYGVEIIDMTHGSCINKENIRTLLPDKVHPSHACHEMIGRELAKRLNFM